MRIEYPFSAVVGQDDLKLALLLTAVDPTIGGVLVRGERGTAKTTAARGLAALLPAKPDGGAAPFVELPLGATEDRVVGSLDVTQALRDGQTRLRSGVLARADGGVLYVDEVNLLPGHLVDLLLDAAATGWVTIERDGVSAGEAARFVLLGTMNPEEGELRPQFVDRFGLSVQVRGLQTQELRMSAVSRRLEFDVDPRAVVEAARAAEDELRRAIVSARGRLPSLHVTPSHLSMVTAICSEQVLDGIRGDLALIKAARALAAWEAAGEITVEHIRRAAELALPHRLRRRAAPRAGLSRATQSKGPSEPAGPSGRAGAGVPTGPLGSPGPGATAASVGATNDETAVQGLAGGPPTAGRPGWTATVLGSPSASATGAAISGTPSAAPGAINLVTGLIDRESSGRRGTGSVASRRSSRATAFDHTGTLAINETLTVAAIGGKRVGEQGVSLTTADLRQYERSGPGRSNVLFLVDASASMATQRRLELAKAAALGILKSNYQHRDEVALMVFRGEGTNLVMPFTNDIERVERTLGDVTTGGRTPLARALMDATELLKTRDPSLLVIFTDGRANVSVSDTDPWDESLAACGPLGEACAGALVIDCEPGPIVLGRARQLAAELHAECIPLATLEGPDLTIRIQSRLESL